MLIYHDAAGKITLTLKGDPDHAPAGTHIEVSDDTDVSEPGSLSVIDGVLVETDITPHKTSAVGVVNLVMNSVRSKYITNIAGQESIYRIKYEEAVAYIAADPEPADLTDYIYMAKEVGVTAPTALELAQVYLNLDAQWRALGALLEEIRIATIASIRAATTKEEIWLIVDGFHTEIGVF